MPITISAPQTMVDEATDYAASRGMTLSELLLNYLAKVIEQKKREKENPFMKFCGILSHAEANELQAIVNEQRNIDEEMWK